MKYTYYERETDIDFTAPHLTILTTHGQYEQVRYNTKEREELLRMFLLVDDSTIEHFVLYFTTDTSYDGIVRLLTELFTFNQLTVLANHYSPIEHKETMFDYALSARTQIESMEENYSELDEDYDYRYSLSLRD